MFDIYYEKYIQNTDKYFINNIWLLGNILNHS